MTTSCTVTIWGYGINFALSPGGSALHGPRAYHKLSQILLYGDGQNRR